MANNLSYKLVLKVLASVCACAPPVCPHIRGAPQSPPSPAARCPVRVWLPPCHVWPTHSSVSNLRHGSVLIWCIALTSDTSLWQLSTDLVSSCSCVRISHKATVVSRCRSPRCSSSSFADRFMLITLTCFCKLRHGVAVPVAVAITYDPPITNGRFTHTHVCACVCVCMSEYGVVGVAVAECGSYACNAYNSIDDVAWRHVPTPSHAKCPQDIWLLFTYICCSSCCRSSCCCYCCCRSCVCYS